MTLLIDNYQEQKRCLNNDIGSILTFKIDDDFNSSIQSISKNFYL